MNLEIIRIIALRVGSDSLGANILMNAGGDDVVGVRDTTSDVGDGYMRVLRKFGLEVDD